MEQFVKASTEFRQIEAHAEMIVKRVNDGASKLVDWKTLLVTNCQAQFPDRLTLRAHPSLSLDAANWPTGEQIGEILAKYHQAGQSVWAAYGTLSKSEQEAVQRPQYYAA
jgi:hypothetical protein